MQYALILQHHQGQEITAVTIRTPQPTTDEGVAITLALKTTEYITILPGTESTYRNYLAGRAAIKPANFTP